MNETKKADFIVIRDKIANIYEASHYLYGVQKNKRSVAAILVRAIEGASQSALESLQRLLNEDVKTDATTDEWQTALNEVYLSFDRVNRAKLLVYADELRRKKA